MNTYKKEDLKKLIEDLSPEYIEETNKLQIAENKKVYEDFISNLNIGKCFLCGMNMNSFKESVPCFHWFTHPIRIRKKHFESYLKKPIGFFKLDSYFRWLANSETFLTNINDLKNETSETSYLETTIKYKNIEWAFSIGKTDLEGHQSSHLGSKPHFHIQMKVDSQIFLKFNDFHIPFSDSDLFFIEFKKQLGDRLATRDSYSAGINILEDEQILQEMDSLMIRSEDELTAPFNRQSLIIAPEGETISGEIIEKAFEESKRTNEPVSKVIQKYMKNLKVITQIVPGEAVPEMTKRSGKKKK